MSTSSESIEGMDFRLCGRCGLRNYVRADGRAPKDFCKRCDPMPEGISGFNVQLHGLCKEVGSEPFAWRIRILDTTGEAVFSTEVADREAGRQLLAKISSDLLNFIKHLGL